MIVARSLALFLVFFLSLFSFCEKHVCVSPDDDDDDISMKTRVRCGERE